MADKVPRKLIEGRPALLVIDVQKMAFRPRPPGQRQVAMPGYLERMQNLPPLIAAARRHDVPVIYFQEAHRPSMVDFGRELDGTEGVHCLENDPLNDIADEVMMRPEDHFIRKRRYSCFFGTELEILLKGLKVNTLLLTGGFTDVCIHYTFVDGHQHDYFCRVVEDCVAGSSLEAHEASLRAMEYLQTGARRSRDEVMRALGDRAG
jgi:nicotinamidase-related amidase